MRKIKLEKVGEGVTLPEYGSEGSAGFDLRVMTVKKVYKGNQEADVKDSFYSNIEKNGHFFMRPFERVLVGTGLKIQLPLGKQLEVRSRSGVTLKRGITILNSPGTVDNDYRGEIGLILYNTTPFLSKVTIGERLAQGVIMDYQQSEFEFVDTLVETQRGEGGYGSTGTK